MQPPTYTAHEYFTAYEPQVLVVLPPEADLTDDIARAAQIAEQAGIGVSQDGRYPAVVWFATFP